MRVAGPKSATPLPVLYHLFLLAGAVCGQRSDTHTHTHARLQSKARLIYSRCLALDAYLPGCVCVCVWGHTKCEEGPAAEVATVEAENGQPAAGQSFSQGLGRIALHGHLTGIQPQ